MAWQFCFYRRRIFTAVVLGSVRGFLPWEMVRSSLVRRIQVLWKSPPPPSLSLCNLVENWVVLLHQQKVYGIASSCQNCKYIELSLCVCRKTGLEFSVYGVPGACQRFLKFQRTRGSAKCWGKHQWGTQVAVNKT